MSSIPNMGHHSLTATNVITSQRQAMQRAGQAAANAISAMNDTQNRESSVLAAGTHNGHNSVGRSAVMYDAMDQASGILDRLGQLATRATDGMLSDADRSVLHHEAQSLQEELGGVFSHTTYNGQPLFQGGSSETYIDGTVSYSDPDGSHVMDELSGIDLSTAAGANAALEKVKNGMHALVNERTVVANASAAVSRHTNLSAAKASVIDSIQDSRNNETFAKSVHQLSNSSIQLASAQLVHNQHLTLLRNGINKLI